MIKRLNTRRVDGQNTLQDINEKLDFTGDDTIGPTLDGTIDLGSSDKRFKEGFINAIRTNTIYNDGPDADLELEADGTGNITFNKTFRPLTDNAADLGTNGQKIKDAFINTTRTNTIISNATNANLTLDANGTGNIVFNKGLLLPTVGDTPRLFNFYSRGSFSLTMGGCFSPTSRTMNFNYERIGFTVFLYWSQQFWTADITSGMTFSNFPAQIQPGHATNIVIPGVLNGSTAVGTLQLTGGSSGTLWTSPDYDGGAAGKFTATFPAGLRIGSTCYKIINP
jgi:hypothetical protein